MEWALVALGCTSERQDAIWRKGRLALSPVSRTHPLHYRFWRRVGLLQIHAPIAKLFQRNGYAGHGAADEGTRPYHSKIAVEIFDLGLARHWRGTICTIKHRHLRACDLGAGLRLRPRFPEAKT